MKKISLSLLFSALALGLAAQISFTDRTNLLDPNSHFSGNALIVTDLNGDGLDDIARIANGSNLGIQYQTTPNQPFVASATTSLPGNNTWGACAADMNNDGFGDILIGGKNNGVKILKSNGNGSFAIQNFTSPIIFVQSVNFADINNDGWLDAFVCNDDGVARIFENNTDGTFSLQPNWIDLTTSPASDNSGNYGSVWSDVNNDGYLDLYIAKCRQNVNDPTDPRRINQLFLNNGDFTFTQDIADVSGLRIGAQSWTADFGDIDNDGDFDCFITNHDVNSQLLENDGAGHFTDITASAGFMNVIQGLPIQGIFRDFDNDGFIDIIVSGGEHYIFKNNADKTFTAIPNPFNTNDIVSIALGDLNNDGFQDVYGSFPVNYVNPGSVADMLWMNNGNNNHFYGLRLRGTQSNRDGVGAKIKVFSALGIQTREVRSGESYGISNSLNVHFGMGQITQIDSVLIDWPSGIQDVIYQPVIDQYITVYEGGCIGQLLDLTADGPTTFCSGEDVTLGTDSLFQSYTWSTGDTNSSITVATTGVYNVTVTDAQGCVLISSPLQITLNPVQIPSIEALGDTTFCVGGEVVLRASAANAYLWNTGATTQDLAVTQSGQYSVSAKGLCAFFPSASMQVEVLDAPEPLVSTDTVLVGESATLSALGNTITWYDSPSNPINLVVNDTLVTPALTQNTTFWVSNTTRYAPPNDFVGMETHQGSASSDINYNGGLIFDCSTPFILEKTLVYTDLAGERQVELRAPNGDVLESKIVNIPAGITLIDLHMDIPIGTDLLLTTNETVNEANIGSMGPQLRRSNQGCDFPYEIPGVVRIKNSTINTSRYYYFYDWEISFYGYECVSERMPVEVVVQAESSTTLPAWAKGLRLYPNPTEGEIFIDIQDFTGGNLYILLRNAQGQAVQARAFDQPAGPAVLRSDWGRLPAGIYWLELSSAAGTAQRKIVVR